MRFLNSVLEHLSMSLALGRNLQNARVFGKTGAQEGSGEGVYPDLSELVTRLVAARKP